jgi:hypothetical protein
LAGDVDGAGETRLDFVVICAASDKERTRGAIIAAAIRYVLDFIDFSNPIQFALKPWGL